MNSFRKGLAVVTGLIAVPLGAPAQQAITIQKVKQLDTGMWLCKGDIPAYEVSVRDGVNPQIEILVALKPAPDSVSDGVQLRIELVDAKGNVVAMADSASFPADSGPPWLETQDAADARYLIALRNRLPSSVTGPGFKLRVSIDSTKGKETPLFDLYWIDLKQRLCQPLNP